MILADCLDLKSWLTVHEHMNRREKKLPVREVYYRMKDGKKVLIILSRD